jgi:UDP-3-O-[3-hydroxymyristoyl] glucosamine N-acyltransferase
MIYKLSQITKELNLDFSGNDCDINGIHTLDEASSTQLSFFNDAKYASSLSTTKAAAVFIDEDHAKLLPSTTIALITDEAYLKLALASKFFAHKLESKGGHPDMGEGCDIDKRVRFGKNVTLGNNVTVLAGCYIGDNVVVGSDTLLHPNVTIYHGSKLGERCIIHSGTVIGCDGYGFAHTKMGEHIKIYQNGNVIIEENVEIGANCTIDRGVTGDTTIGEGSKLDNLIQIAHDTIIGKKCLMASLTAVAGCTIIEDEVTIWGQCGIVSGITIGKKAVLMAQSGVSKSIEGGKVYWGSPVTELRDRQKELIAIRKLPELLKKMK